MKKMILGVMMLAVAAFAYAQETKETQLTQATQETAAGTTEKSEWLPTFESITVDADLDIKFIKVPDTQAPKIVYDTKGSYTTKFRADVKDKVLRITERWDTRRPERTHVTVYYNTMNALSLSGVIATFEAPIEQTMLDLVVSHKASLTAEMNIQDLKMDLTGDSGAKLSGKVRYLSLYASTGKVDASKLEVMSAEVNAQSKANVQLWLTDRFVGKTSTNGQIIYKGKPQIVRSGSRFMGGEITRTE